MTARNPDTIERLLDAQSAKSADVRGAVCKRHRWRTATWTYKPSLADRLAENGLGVVPSNLSSVREIEKLFGKPLLITYRCADCGTEEVRRV